MDNSTPLNFEILDKNNASYLKFLSFLLPEVYPLIFCLVPEEKIAMQIFSNVVQKQKLILNNSKTVDDFIPSFRRTSINESMKYLRDVKGVLFNRSDIENSKKLHFFKLNEVDKEFLLLSFEERVVLTLADIGEFNSNQISTMMKNLSTISVQEILRSARNKLIMKYPFDEVKGFNNDQWILLNQNLLKLDMRLTWEISDLEFDLINKYLSYCKSILAGCLKHIIPPENILLKLKEKLDVNSESITWKTNVKDDQRIHKNQEESEQQFWGSQEISSNFRLMIIYRIFRPIKFSQYSKIAKRICLFLIMSSLLFISLNIIIQFRTWE